MMCLIHAGIVAISVYRRQCFQRMRVLEARLGFQTAVQVLGRRRGITLYFVLFCTTLLFWDLAWFVAWKTVLLGNK